LRHSPSLFAESVGGRLDPAGLRTERLAGPNPASVLPPPTLQFVEANFLQNVTAAPNDPSYPAQWSLNNTGQDGGIAGADIDAEQAWGIQTGSGSVTVAVIDTGVSYSHPDLQANMWTNAADACGNLVDDDGNTYIDDCRGWNFVAGTNDPSDDNGHGTHVAGIVGAAGNNLTGVSGVAWSVKLMPIKVFNSVGTGDNFHIQKGIEYAISKGAKIINYSAGGTTETEGISTAIVAARSAGIRGLVADTKRPRERVSFRGTRLPSRSRCHFLIVKLNSICSKPPTQKHHSREQMRGDRLAQRSNHQPTADAEEKAGLESRDRLR
jgi:subtilisin family serine protease